MAGESSDASQEAADRFYHAHGRCCAGCDWWARVNSVAGECRRGPPVGGREKVALLGIEGCSIPAEAGHILTPRGHVCGEFRDTFDWASLPPAYRRRIGVVDAD